MNRIELLSPAGSFDALKAAVNYGADAVYLGGTNFSARAFANNFNHEELIEAVKYCHLRGVKVYVTLNTLLNDDEIVNAFNEAKFYYENNVDALIVQDLGLFYLIKKELPDFDLHASTQMHIHNISGVKNAKKLGFKKVVLARESNLDLIREACKEDIEIECFVHGAICVSYSGQCLMSSVTKNRSANKGMCAQCCRLKYTLFDKTTNKSVDTKTDYLLSPKDMYLLKDIPNLIEAGVTSLKIEGRLKSPAYVGLVTHLYRKAIDSYYEGKTYDITKEEYDNLLSVFNRGFTDSYLKGNNSSIFDNIRPNHMGKEIGKVISFNDGHCVVRLFKDVNQFDGIRIINSNEDVGKILNTLSVKGKYVSTAKKDDIIEFNIDSKVSKGDIVVKTLDSKLEENINNYNLIRKPLNIKIDFIENKPIKISCYIKDKLFEKEFNTIPDVALKAPISFETIHNQFSKFKDEPFYLNNLEINLGNAFLPMSKINDVRREFIDDIKTFILNDFNRSMIPFIELNELKDENNNDNLIENLCDNLNNIGNLVKDPVINPTSKYDNMHVVSEFGGLLNVDKDKIAYYTLNVSNSYAYEFLKRIGFSKIVLSSELNNRSIERLVNSYKQRTGYDIKPYVLAFGRRSLMYLKKDPIENYEIEGHLYALSDRNNEYIFKKNEKYNEIIEEIPYFNTEINENIALKLLIINELSDIGNIEKKLKIRL